MSAGEVGGGGSVSFGLNEHKNSGKTATRANIRGWFQPPQPVLTQPTNHVHIFFNYILNASYASIELMEFMHSLDKNNKKQTKKRCHLDLLSKQVKASICIITGWASSFQLATSSLTPAVVTRSFSFLKHPEILEQMLVWRRVTSLAEGGCRMFGEEA